MWRHVHVSKQKTCCLHHHGRLQGSFIYFDYEFMALWNVATFLTHYTQSVTFQKSAIFRSTYLMVTNCKTTAVGNICRMVYFRLRFRVREQQHNKKCFVGNHFISKKTKNKQILFVCSLFFIMGLVLSEKRIFEEVAKLYGKSIQHHLRV
jgi:hypothetical protein